jgi:hypothetical protein
MLSITSTVGAFTVSCDQGTDCPCAGAQVVFQEDNAGPHTNHEYAAWMKEAFAANGWKIELQAPQGNFNPPNYNTLPYHLSTSSNPPANLKPCI